MLFVCFPAQHGRGQRGSARSAALFRGAPDGLRHVPAGERTLHVSVAGSGQPAGPLPEPLQPALPRPPARTRGQNQLMLMLSIGQFLNVQIGCLSVSQYLLNEPNTIRT